MICNIFRSLNNSSLSSRIINYSTSVSIKNVQTSNIGDVVHLQGWIMSLRKMKENIFVDIYDGSCDNKMQIVVPTNLKQKELSYGSSVKVTGVINKSPKGALELYASELEICGKGNVTDGYPFASKKPYAFDYIRQYLHLRTKTSRFASTLRVRDGVQQLISKYLHKNGYIQVHTPILTSNDCEGAGETFTVTIDNKKMLKDMLKESINIEDAYFDKKVYLTVSGQLHLEAAAHGLSNVYSFGPAFRAENSNTRLHLAEFYMLEVEKAFTNDLKDLTSLVEDLLKNVTAEALTDYADDIKRCRNDEVDVAWLNKPFAVLEYEEAVRIVKNKREFKVPFNEKRGFSKEHELYLVEYNDGVPTFVVNWPKESKQFYMKECLQDSMKVAAFDLFTPVVGELVGGSLREDNYSKLKDRIPNGTNALDWYLDLRKFGGCPTGGFGLGFERYLIMLLNVHNVKDAIPFPRWPHNCAL